MAQAWQWEISVTPRALGRPGRSALRYPKIVVAIRLGRKGTFAGGAFLGDRSGVDTRGLASVVDPAMKAEGQRILSRAIGNGREVDPDGTSNTGIRSKKC